MSMFGKSKEEKAVKSSNSTTIITGCMNIQGNIDGCGTIHIDGTILGDLTINENIIIGASGKITGNIKAKKIIISGQLEGSVTCDTLEVTKSGIISDSINAKSIISDGTLNATILAKESIHITENGKVTTRNMQSKYIIVNGHIDGDVTASELLEINKDGQVKGTMKVKKIKVTEGGLMLGTMLTYEAVDSVKIKEIKDVNKNSENKEK